jgi:hypothetical protein
MAVVQRGMNPENHLARRYHWHSTTVRDFVFNPHTAILGRPQGKIMNLVDARAANAQQTLLTIAREPIGASLQEARKLTMPAHHDVRAKDVDLKRLGAVLAVGHEQELRDFASLLLVEGLGPRTLQSQHYQPIADFGAALAHEHDISVAFGGRTVFDDLPSRGHASKSPQMDHF